MLSLFFDFLIILFFMDKKNIIEIINFIDNEFQKYGVHFISQESYEMLYNLVLLESHLK